MTRSNDDGSRADRVAPQRAAADDASNPKGDSEHDSRRRLRIETAAYYRAKARGFIPGLELDDWLAAEAQIATDVSDRDGNTQIEGVGGGLDEQPVASAPGGGSMSATRSDGNPPASAKQKTDRGSH